MAICDVCFIWGSRRTRFSVGDGCFPSELGLKDKVQRLKLNSRNNNTALLMRSDGHGII